MKVTVIIHKGYLKVFRKARGNFCFWVRRTFSPLITHSQSFHLLDDKKTVMRESLYRNIT